MAEEVKSLKLKVKSLKLKHMSWLLIVIIAHFFSAGIFIVDRYLLKRGFPNPLSYAFWVGVLSIFIIVLAPFGFSFPSKNQIILSLVAGIIWLISAVIFYNALYKGETSRVVPMVGGLTPLFIFGLSFIFLGERLSIKELIAICFLVSGRILLSLLVTKTEHRNFWQSRKIRLVEVFIPVIGAALTSAIYFVITKSVLSNIGFINGLIWIRLGTALGALFLLIPNSFRQMIFKKGEAIKPKALGLFVLARAWGVASGFLIYWAIFLGSVTLVNSLQGVQYLFLLLLAFLLFKKIPQLKEQLERGVLVQKIIAIILIGVGLAILII